ncbi:HlyU family transcriptional regulator [Vibrio salinus]|uniref:HlyU family transcriptional regulator n=1 Tax=Vibrio salinus TaxID=2899784 RepID=UPI001E5B6AFE|nr:HlyU family transcriptional regulator [Vibrio salinus]MCE0495817.1 HlyU family transcriptional regulator [Vibrio salinus]
MGFLSALFGSKKKEESSPEVEPISYKSYLIFPEARPENGQFRIAGRICTPAQGEQEAKEHLFIRSDVLMTREDADELMVRKAKMLIDQMGDKIFS